MRKLVKVFHNLSKYKRIYFILLLILGFLLTLLASKFESLVESIFTNGIYKFFLSTLGYIYSLVSFSVSEILMYLVFLFVIGYISFFVIRIIKIKKNRRDTILRFFSTILAGASIIYFLFVIFCGLNYYRQPFADKFNLEVRSSSNDELYRLCDLLITKANMVRETLKEDEDSVARLNDNSIYETAKRAGEEYYLFSKGYKSLEGIKIYPKPVFSSELMSKFSITGIFSPFTFEANMNVNVPIFTLPASMFHELSHVKGVMREDEANFIAFLTCINSKDNDFIYSGLLLALDYSMIELYNGDVEKFTQLRRKYSNKMNLDIEFEQEYWTRYQDKFLFKVSNEINNIYLNGNNQPQGTKTYGLVVDLLLAYYSKQLK